MPTYLNTNASLSNRELLVAAHCGLDDGGINEAGRALYILRGRADLTADEREWLASLDSLYLSCCGSMSHWGCHGSD